MLPLAGYAERLSARPGQTLRFHVANATGQPVHADVVRVICADPNPAIGGVQTEPVSVPVRLLQEPTAQGVPIGSYGALGRPGLLDGLQQLTCGLRVFPTLSLPRRQVLLSCRDETGSGLEIELTAALALRVWVGTRASSGVSSGITLETNQPVGLNRWSRVSLILDGNACEATLVTQALDGSEPAQVLRAFCTDGFALAARGRRLSIASASDTAPIDCFNGRLEAPVLLACALDDAQDPAETSAAHPHCIAAWDFSREISTRTLVDVGPQGQHGEVFNTPTRAVTGSRWTGEEHNFRHAPQHYGAVHFHEDDLDDCRWPATHEIVIPEACKSDAYALMLTAGDARENIPFFVVPPKGVAQAPIAVLVSTYTYTVYGNHARPEWLKDARWREAYIEQARQWRAYPYNPGEHRDYGLSTYNYHPDGSGIGLVSWHRPMLNLRVGYFTYPYPEIRGSGLRHYPADSHLLMWLSHQGHAFDLITDEELHQEGLSLLARYKTVLTGTHPEYHTPQMLDALTQYRDQGGRLVYLGGNGFYWKIALDPQRAGIVEIRRGEGGIRAWAAEPGEYYQQFDGQYGGLWRRNARPPQKLAGVGFTAQGNFVGSHYRVNEDARRDPRVSWAFEGIDAATIGGYGFSGHGAAGFELDRLDKRLGSPANAIVLARSENHPPEAPWILVPEEQLTHITTIPGESHQALIRADMVYFETPAGGEVFSVGSITFCGSLPHQGFDNDISRLLDNVVRRFTR